MTIFVMYDKDGVITQSGECPDDHFDIQIPAPDCHILEGYGQSTTHYVLNNEICAYSDSELQAKNNISFGWTWKMPDRIAIDLRTSEQKSSDASQIIDNLRRAAYPPLTDFADAMYWQAQGDNSKMTAYIAACEAVKLKYPK